MAIVPTPYKGKTKRHIVEGAYEFCGLNGFEFERTAEEMSSALGQLNDLMAELPTMGYDFPEYGNGDLATPSGLPDSVVSAIKQRLALRLAPGLGATLSDEAKADMARTWTRLQSNYVAPPGTMAMRSVPVGAGNRSSYSRFFGG